MDIGPIIIQKIRAKDLVSFAKEINTDSKIEKFVPITLKRAISHTHNPFVSEEDICLLVAYDQQEIVGYFGIMPIMLKRGEELSKVYWFTTWLVSPKYRGKSIGSLLMKEALTLEQDYMIVGSGPARKVCVRFGFNEFNPLEYYLLDLSGLIRLNPLTWGFRFIRKLTHRFGLKIKTTNDVTKWFERIASPLTKRIFSTIINRIFIRQGHDYIYTETNLLKEAPLGKNYYQPPVAFYRPPAILNWMLEYPWVQESKSSQADKQEYYFTEVRKIFRNLVFEVYSRESQEYKGGVVFSLSEIEGKLVLKVLDCKFISPQDERSIIALVAQINHQYSIDTVELPKHLGDMLKNRIISRILLHKKSRIYQCHPKNENSLLGQTWQDIELNYCDGDMAFT